MIRYFKKALPLSILATGIMASASFADTFTLRVDQAIRQANSLRY